MTHDEHRQRHQYLHHRLDELFADMIRHTHCLPSSTTVMQLIEWSHKQTIEPTEEATNTGTDTVPKASLTQLGQSSSERNSTPTNNLARATGRD